MCVCFVCNFIRKPLKKILAKFLNVFSFTFSSFSNKMTPFRVIQ